MFVLDELDKLLKKIAPSPKEERQVERVRISLKDIEQLDVEQMQLALKVHYHPLLSSSGRIAPAKIILDLNELVENGRKNPSLDRIFFELIYRLVLGRLIQLPERHYPSARIVVCDQASYEMLMKFERISSSLNSLQCQPSGVNLKNLIYKRPFSATAIFPLSGIVDLFERQPEPIITVKLNRATGATVMAYNNAAIRSTFPYLRMSDLLIVLHDRMGLELGLFNLKSSREHQILQFLNHFARTSQLVELNVSNRILSKMHPIYNNVLVAEPHDISSDTIGLLFDKLPVLSMSKMINQLMQMIELLRLNVRSVSYRIDDGQTKAFSQLLSTSLKAKEKVLSSRDARVIVIDRFFDVGSVMLHADRYGAYLEQEKLFRSPVNLVGVNRLQVDAPDQLDELLQLNQLTTVLTTILRYSIELKTSKTSKATNLTLAMSASQTIKKHLDQVKIIYQTLNEGYLLMLRLELSLESFKDQLRGRLDQEKQEDLCLRLERILFTFKQLINIPGNSIKALDLARVACLLMDIGNMFMFALKKTGIQPIKQMDDMIQEAIFRSKEFEQALKVKQDSEDLDTTKSLMKKLAKFNNLSRDSCAQRSWKTLEQLVEDFLNSQLEPDSFATVLMDGADSPARRTTVHAGSDLVLVFLGALTPHELSRIKALETVYRSKSACNLSVLTYALLEPATFFKAL